MGGRFRFSKNFVDRLRIEFVILGEKIRLHSGTSLNNLIFSFTIARTSRIYFLSEMSIFAFSRNGRASSMKRSIDIWATYWPLSQKHLFRSNAALRRLIFSSSK